MKMIKWGVLSTAEIAQKLTIPAMIRANNAELYAIASASGNAREVAEKFHIPHVFDSYEALLADPEIDAVYIPLPNHIHKEWTIKAANQGKHILCEKPSSLNPKDTEEMVQVCKENGVHFSETFIYQYHPQNKRVKEVIQTGEIGNIRHVHANCSFFLEGKENNFRLNRQEGGGSLYDVGVYCIHTIRSILEADPIHVTGTADLNEQQVDMAAQMTLHFKNGVKGTFVCGMNMAKHMAYEVIGSDGVIQIPRAYQPDAYGGIGLMRVLLNDGTHREEYIRGDDQKLAIEHFGRCVLYDETPTYPAADSIANMKTLASCFSAIKRV